MDQDMFNVSMNQAMAGQLDFDTLAADENENSVAVNQRMLEINSELSLTAETLSIEGLERAIQMRRAQENLAKQSETRVMLDIIDREAKAEDEASTSQIQIKPKAKDDSVRITAKKDTKKHFSLAA